MSHGGDEDNIRVSRINDDSGDVASIIQTEVHPTSSPVRRAIDAVAIRIVFSKVGFTTANVDNIWIARRNGDCANGGDCRLAVGEIRPALAGVRRFPDAAIDRAKVEDAGVTRVSADGDRPSAAKGPNQAPTKTAELGSRALVARRVDGLCW